MRITGGTFRGRVLKTPKDRKLRPTSERVREALFDILGQAIVGAGLLDCFAGTGAIGFEALSRQAAKVCFVEQDPQAGAILRKNADILGLNIKFFPGDFFKIAKRLHLSGNVFDYAFVDPPYMGRTSQDAVIALFDLELVKKDGCVIVEHDTRNDPGDAVAGFIRSDQRVYGETALSFYGYGQIEDE